NARYLSYLSAKTNRAILSKHGSISTSINAGAQATLAVRNKLFHIQIAHCCEVIDIQIALRAVANAVIALHLIPVSCTWRSNANFSAHVRRLYLKTSAFKHQKVMIKWFIYH